MTNAGPGAEPPNLPERVEWRGRTFIPVLDRDYFHCKGLGSVWWSSGAWCWLAALDFQGTKAKRDMDKDGSRGTAPEEALDEEVRMWLRGVLSLPGAVDHAMVQSVLES